eukprot:scaffold238096_cov19-Tisochrysis_lutea.AAC.1
MVRRLRGRGKASLSRRGKAFLRCRDADTSAILHLLCRTANRLTEPRSGLAYVDRALLSDYGCAASRNESKQCKRSPVFLL